MTREGGIRRYRLAARFVVHTVGPVWRGGNHGERKLLATCYRSILAACPALQIPTLAIPAISCGAFGFPCEAVLKKAVHIDWRSWDPHAEDPAEYPAEGEPVNYILRRKHRVGLAGELPTLREIFIPVQPGLQREGGAVDLAQYDGSDIARANRFGYVYVSKRLADWLSVTVPEWVSLEPATCVVT